MFFNCKVTMSKYVLIFLVCFLSICLLESQARIYRASFDIKEDALDVFGVKSLQSKTKEFTWGSRQSG